MPKSVDISPARKFSLRRVLSSILATVFGIYLGWWVASHAYQLVTEIFPAEKIGSIWGTGVVAAAALWKVLTDSVESARNSWRYVIQIDEKFDHFKAMLTVATVAFGLVLGFLSAKNIFNSPENPQGNTEIVPVSVELVYVVSHQGKEAPSFLVSPTLVFASARLRNPDMPDRSDPSIPVERSDFLDSSVSLSQKQIESASRLISKLAKECTYEDADEPLELIVYGFANDLPILNSRKENRTDSDRLNVIVSNLRGQAVYNALEEEISKQFRNLSEVLVVQWKPWRSISEMRSVRDNKVFRNVQIALSPTIDHRSAVIVVSKPGICPLLVTP